MKKFIIVIASFLLAVVVPAQVSAQKKVLLQKDAGNTVKSPFIGTLEVIENTATSNPSPNLSIVARITQHESLGKLMVFSANAAIEKIDVVVERGTSTDKSTTVYNANTLSGQFVLQAPLYAGFSKLTFNYYVKGKPQPVWTSAVKVVKQTIRSVPKQIQ